MIYSNRSCYRTWYHDTLDLGLQSLDLGQKITDTSILPISENVSISNRIDASLIVIAKHSTGLQSLRVYYCNGLSANILRDEFKSIYNLPSCPSIPSFRSSFKCCTGSSQVSSQTFTEFFDEMLDFHFNNPLYMRFQKMYKKVTDVEQIIAKLLDWHWIPHETTFKMQKTKLNLTMKPLQNSII